MTAALASVRRATQIKGRVTLPRKHRCMRVLGGKCLVCELKRRSLDGEVVHLHIVVQDVDDEA